MKNRNNTGTYPSTETWNGHPRINGIAWGFQIEDDGDPGRTFTVIHDEWNTNGEWKSDRSKIYNTILIVQVVGKYTMTHQHKSSSVELHASWIVNLINAVAEWNIPPVDFVERVTTILNGIETNWDPKLKV